MGLSSFLTSCARRPNTFEELCRGLWNYNEAYTASKATMRPSWFPHGGDASLARCTNAFHIEQWWFTSLVANISEALAEFRDVAWSRTAVPGFYKLVPGLSIALLKQLPSGVKLQGIPALEVIKTCKALGFDLHTVELKDQSGLRDAAVAIYRGISYRGCWLSVDGDGGGMARAACCSLATPLERPSDVACCCSRAARFGPARRCAESSEG